jgi:hypothetical protein
MIDPALQEHLGRDGANRSADDSSVVARKRAFLLLEGHREALDAKLRHRDRPSKRYEDLCVVTTVIRLQRDCLTESTRLRLDDDFHPSPDGNGAETVEATLAEWARPWGERCLAELAPDLDHYSGDLRKTRRWLSYWTQRKAETRAADRLDAITAEVREALAPPKRRRFPPH